MNKERYEILLAELATLIKEKNDKIQLQDHIIDTLTKKLEAAENTLLTSGKPNIERR